MVSLGHHLKPRINVARPFLVVILIACTRRPKSGNLAAILAPAYFSAYHCKSISVPGASFSELGVWKSAEHVAQL